MLNKMLMAAVVGGGALLGASAQAAPSAVPLAKPIPTLASPQVQTVYWGDWHHRWWHRHEARRDWRHREHWAWWHRWHGGWNHYYR